jgi:hypothetical protein
MRSVAELEVDAVEFLWTPAGTLWSAVKHHPLVQYMSTVTGEGSFMLIIGLFACTSGDPADDGRNTGIL